MVFVFHQPPYNTKLDKVYESKSGNKDYADFIKKHTPDLVICGHIHENFKKRDKIKRTIIINPGPDGENVEIL